MDDTLLKGRTIFVFAEKRGFTDKLLNITNSSRVSYKKTIEIAKLLKGASARKLLEIFRNIPLQEHVEDTLTVLKNKGIKTAIVTNSYQFLADDLKDRLGIDYAFANNLIIKKDIVTGEIIINNKTKKKCDNGKIYSICKGHILDHLCNTLNIDPKEVIAVGDGMIDVGMIKKAGLGIAFNAPKEVQKHADIITNDLKCILSYI